MSAETTSRRGPYTWQDFEAMAKTDLITNELSYRASYQECPPYSQYDVQQLAQSYANSENEKLDLVGETATADATAQ